ncbi:Zinc/iron permease [Coemansia spiralis]|nr:Zinc/iron permease [Coemansia spiralis]
MFNLSKHLCALLALLICSSHILVTAAASSVKSKPYLHKRHGADAHEASDDLECYASGVEDWQKGIHIGAIFIVMAMSGLGSFLPIISKFVPQLHVPKIALTIGKFLGTGVIISTALIHMLPEGSESLSNPCIGDRMGNYGGWPGVLAIMAILLMHLMEFLMSNYAMSKHGHEHGAPANIEKSSGQALEQGSNVTNSGTPEHKLSVDSHDISRVRTDNQNQENCDANRISTYILELGICLHSVIIGVTLSITTGSSFKTLLIAICFHQLCEGLALGSRLAEVSDSRKSHRKAFLTAAISALVFMLITPLGMVIGIGVRYSYQPNSPTALMAMGVLDSLSAGILLYTGLVNLLVEEFGTLEFRGFRVSKKVACFIACYIGAGVMALIGNWA